MGPGLNWGGGSVSSSGVQTPTALGEPNVRLRPDVDLSPGSTPWWADETVCKIQLSPERWLGGAGRRICPKSWEVYSRLRCLYLPWQRGERTRSWASFASNLLFPSGMRIRVLLGNRIPLRWANGKHQVKELCMGSRPGEGDPRARVSAATASIGTSGS